MVPITTAVHREPIMVIDFQPAADQANTFMALPQGMDYLRKLIHYVD
jgi:hypothetical protein